MAESRLTCRDESVAEENDSTQRAVLAILLGAHPAQLAVDEVITEITAGDEGSATGDRAEVALRHLVGAGLVHRHGRFVFPTRAAVRFEELGG